MYDGITMQKQLKHLVLIFSFICFSSFGGVTVDPSPLGLGNDPQKEQEFMDLGFGLFIHWSMDSELGSVISHSMVGASDKYLDRYTKELPKTFYPHKFDPDEWARLFKMSGAEYVVFTAKHHNGFAMWDTQTTEFNIMNTPYGKDITGMLIKSLRKHGLKVGIYFSPEDFHFLHNQGTLISRTRFKSQIVDNPELLAYDKKQVHELLTQYGEIDMIFFDAFKTRPIVDYVHQNFPKVIVTRGEMETPEQKIPNMALPGPWETCMTMGTQWQYKPTNEVYKPGPDLINKLSEIRAKGGNFLLNIGPKPDGTIAIEQEERLREVGLWSFINDEAIKGIRPLPNTVSENGIWFTQNEKENAVYLIIPHAKKEKPWGYGERKEIKITTLKATKNTAISVLGQSSKVLEYQPDVDASSSFKQEGDTLELSIMRAQRIYNNKRWPNAIVVKLTNVEIVK